MIKLVYGLRTETFDIHRPATDKMFYFSFYLGRTGRVIGTIISCFTFITYQFASTLRAVSNESHFIANHYTGIFVYTNNLWNNFTAFLYIYHIANVKIESFNNICIMERGAFYHCSRQLHRVKIGNRSNGSRTPYLISHFVQAGTCPFCLKLIGNSPTGRLGCITKITLLTQRIDFQYNTIRSNRKIFTLGIPISDKLKYLFQCFTLACNIRYLKAPFFYFFQIFVMAVIRQVFT